MRSLARPASVVLAVAVVAACSGTHAAAPAAPATSSTTRSTVPATSAAPAPTPTGAHPVGLGLGLGFVAGDGAAYLLEPIRPNDTKIELVRIDAGTGRVTARVPVPGEEFSAAFAGGTVWVAARSASKAATVTGFDPLSLRTRHQVGLPADATAAGQARISITVTAGHLWVAGGEAAFQLSEMSGQVVREIRLPASTTSSSIAADAADLVVCLDGYSAATIELLDPTTGVTRVTYVDHASNEDTVVFVDNNLVWLVEGGGMANGFGALDLLSAHIAHEGGGYGGYLVVAGSTILEYSSVGSSYCADGATGRTVQLPAYISHLGEIVGIIGGQIYVDDQGPVLERIPFSGCPGHS